MKQRIVSLCLCLSMTLALSACQSSPQTSVSDASDTAPAATAAAATAAASTAAPAPAEASEASVSAAEPEISVSYPLTDDGYTFTCWTTYGPNMADYLGMVDTLPAFQKADDITGVTVHFEACDQSTQPEKLNLYVASGTMPDVMCSMVSLYSTGGEGLIDDELAYNINDYLDLMPYYSSYIDDMDASAKKGMYTDSGYLPAVYSLRLQENFGMNIRQDWLDALNLDAPRTYDELENVLKAFKDKYGCRNALYMLQDYGYTNYGLASGYDTMVNAAQNMLHFYQIDGTVYSGDFNDGARDYIQMLANWYQEGLFSDDCVTLKNIMDNEDIIYKDGAGVWFSEPNYQTDEYRQHAQDPNFRVSAIPEVGKTAGQELHMYSVAPGIDGQSAWTITTSCTEPELVCQYIDWFFSPDGYIAANWGTEGESFEYGADGKPYYTDLVLKTTEYPTVTTAITMYTGTPLPCGTAQEANDARLDPVISESGDIYRSNQDGAYVCAYSLTSAEYAEFVPIAADIITRKSEVISQIVMGEADISAYDDLLSYATDTGLDRLVEIVQGAYDRYNRE